MIAQSKRQQGVTLVEVLITVLVLSVGLLGVAGLQGTSLRNTYSANQRTQAVNMGYEVMDALRADRKRVISSGIPAGYLAVWENQAAQVLAGGGIDVQIEPQGTAFFVLVSLAWLDDRGQATESSDCAGEAEATRSAGNSDPSDLACTRLNLVSEL